MTTLTLTPDAAAKLATLTLTLAELGLSANQVHALLLAQAAAEDAQAAAEDPDAASPEDALEDVLASWQEDGHTAWADVLCEIPTFLAAAA